MSNIKIKRIYDMPSSSDGLRILVDRVWPRGITKEKAQLTMWMKEIAPSTELRIWFQHLPERFEEFKRRYELELADEAVRPYIEQLKSLVASNTVTLLYSAKNDRYNQAVVIKPYIERAVFH